MGRTLVICGVIIAIFGIVCDLAVADRKIEILVNPNCTDSTLCEQGDHTVTNATFNNLVYVRATGSDDTLHYLWSSVGTLSLLVAVTNQNSVITVNWTAFLANQAKSISFNPPPSYEAVVVFTNLYIYDDKDDEVVVDKGTDVKALPLNAFGWQGVEIGNSSSQQAQAKFRSSEDNGNDYGKLLQFNINAFGYKDHASLLPSLLHTENSLQLEMILDHFNTTVNTRYAVEIAVISSEPKETNRDFQLETHKSIDDEYTPGVFTVIELTSPDSRDDKHGSYLQWKPVIYTSTARTTADSTVTQQSLQTNTTGLGVTSLTSSLANAYFGDDILENLTTSVMNISYGLHGDGFYVDYLSWTVTIGTGRPSQESFSTMVIAVIIVGFGVPAILIIVAGIIILARRCRRSNDDLTRSNERLVDDEQ